MSLWDSVKQLLVLEPLQHQPLQTRDSASLQDFIARVDPRAAVPWRPATVREALSVPAVYGIVSTISNTIGTLSLEAFRNGRRMDPDRRPQIVKRPDPDRRPGSFFRDSAWNLATRGEAWWLVAKRDDDGNALSLINIPPHEVVVDANPDDRRSPIIRWMNKEWSADDMRQITYSRDAGDLRGMGPLQWCGAAVSVAVEAQEWAANFYAEGGKGGTIIKSARELGVVQGEFSPSEYDHEAEILRQQWIAKAHNLVRVIDPNIESVDDREISDAGAQMLKTRDFQVGELARMFGFPQSLIGYSVPGSSLTYQNVGQELDKLTRTCLIPNYLEKFEQEMTDLLTRSTTCQFNVDRLLRADIKTRYDVYGIAVGQGILSVEEVRDLEGYGVGDVETARVPFSPPQAVPDPIPAFGTMREVRHVCTGGKTRFLGRSNGGSEHYCPHCKQVISAA